MLQRTPMEFLPASVAACFLRSCRIVRDARGEAPAPIRVETSCRKAEIKPNGLTRTRIAYAIDDCVLGDSERLEIHATRFFAIGVSLSSKIVPETLQ